MSSLLYVLSVICFKTMVFSSGDRYEAGWAYNHKGCQHHLRQWWFCCCFLRRLGWLADKMSHILELFAFFIVTIFHCLHMDLTQSMVACTSQAMNREHCLTLCVSLSLECKLLWLSWYGKQVLSLAVRSFMYISLSLSLVCVCVGVRLFLWCDCFYFLGFILGYLWAFL